MLSFFQMLVVCLENAFCFQCAVLLAAVSTIILSAAHSIDQCAQCCRCFQLVCRRRYNFVNNVNLLLQDVSFFSFMCPLFENAKKQHMIFVEKCLVLGWPVTNVL